MIDVTNQSQTLIHIIVEHAANIVIVRHDS